MSEEGMEFTHISPDHKDGDDEDEIVRLVPE
jgi:hypothetical protein